MTKKYQKSLDIFKSVFFKNGILDYENWGVGPNGLDKKEYMELAYRIFNISKIKGRSAFTPKIIFRHDKHCSDGRGSFILTLDQNSRFAER